MVCTFAILLPLLIHLYQQLVHCQILWCRLNMDSMLEINLMSLLLSISWWTPGWELVTTKAKE